MAGHELLNSRVSQFRLSARKPPVFSKKIFVPLPAILQSQLISPFFQSRLHPMLMPTESVVGIFINGQQDESEGNPPLESKIVLVRKRVGWVEAQSDV